MGFRLNKPSTLLAFLSGAFVLDHLDRHILNITLNQIGVEFALNDLQLGLLSGFAFALIHVVLAFPLARLAVPGRRKTMVVASLSVWSLLTMAMGAATSFVQLLAIRFGVGIGEAGYVPSAHSMIAERFPEEKRVSALAVFSAATNIGLFLAFIVGGIVASKFGWRMAFLVAGVPGVFLALAMAFGLNEPNEANPSETTEAMPRYWALFKSLFADPATRNAIFGAGLAATVGFGATAWIATFLIRIHGLEIAQVGLYLAGVIGIGGALGTWLGGRCADRLGQYHPGRRLKFVAITIILAKPVAMAVYLIDNTALALVLFAFPAAVGAIFAGPSFGQVYNAVKPQERAMAAAIMMLILNLVGFGLGPIIVGLISHLLEPSLGGDALRYALAALQVIGFWSAYHFWQAGRLIKG